MGKIVLAMISIVLLVEASFRQRTPSAPSSRRQLLSRLSLRGEQRSRSITSVMDSMQGD
jgi:hypothetical protein